MVKCLLRSDNHRPLTEIGENSKNNGDVFSCVWTYALLIHITIHAHSFVIFNLFVSSFLLEYHNEGIELCNNMVLETLKQVSNSAKKEDKLPFLQVIEQ